MASFLQYFSDRTSGINMLLGILILLCSTLVFQLADTAPAIAKSRQYIEPLPGYIPVYIRPGNTPLEDINLDLAEAFESYAVKHGRFNYGRSSKVAETEKSDISEVKLEEEEDNNDIVPVNNQKETVINLNDLSLGVPVAIALPDFPEPNYVHIQKIPRKPSS